MIFPDVNVLLYAYDRGSQFHKAASRWLENVLSEKEVFFSWHTITGFLRIITHPSILSNPASLKEAVQVVSEWLDRENTHLVSLEKRHWPIFASILIDGKATGSLVMDAHIAAMASACGAAIATTDRDFARFPDVRIIDPLSPRR